MIAVSFRQACHSYCCVKSCSKQLQMRVAQLRRPAAQLASHTLHHRTLPLLQLYLLRSLLAP